MDPRESAAFWDKRYAEADRVWSENANALLVDFAGGLAPGRALDIGAGEGRNAIWLARAGWEVLALDVSAVGLARAVERAAEAGVELDCVTADWHEYVPRSPVDLVIISFMHPRPEERAAMFGLARAALAPGGHLLTVGVDVSEHERRGPPDADRLYTPERLKEALTGFDVLRCEQVAYEGEARDGRRPVLDVVAIAQRPRAE